MAGTLPLLLRKRIKRKIREAGAVSEDTAKTSEELGIDKTALRWSAYVKDIKRTEDGRYYLCEPKK